MPIDIRLIQNEIKDIVITRLLSQVYQLHKEQSRLREENLELKNSIADTYKKMVVMKSTFSHTSKKKDTFLNMKDSFDMSLNIPKKPATSRFVSFKTFSPKNQQHSGITKMHYRNKLSNLANNHKESGSLIENQSSFLTSNDGTKTTRVISNKSPKVQIMALSPRKIKDYSQCLKTERLSSNKYTFTLDNNNNHISNYSIIEAKPKRFKITKNYDNKRQKDPKKMIKVSLKNQSKKGIII